MTTASTPTAGGSKVRVGVQRFGTFLSGMIMPNIPALIAWGIFTAFFIEVGWTPNADLATIVGPFIHYLLPIIIAYTGGNIIYGIRGGVVASIAVMGAIAGSDFLIAQFNATLAEGESTARTGAHVHRRDDHGSDRRLLDEVARQPVGGQDQGGLRDARQHVLGRHLGLRHGRGGLLPHRLPGQRTHADPQQRGRLARDDEPPAADEHHHRAGEGAVPQQRHQPRRADAARHPGVRRGRDPRSSSSSRPTPAPVSDCCSRSRSSASARHAPRLRARPSSSSSAASTRCTSRTRS